MLHALVTHLALLLTGTPAPEPFLLLTGETARNTALLLAGGPARSAALLASGPDRRTGPVPHRSGTAAAR